MNEEVLLIVLIILVLINILLVLFKKAALRRENEEQLRQLYKVVDNHSDTLANEFHRNRQEQYAMAKAQREELGQNLRQISEAITTNNKQLNEHLISRLQHFINLQQTQNKDSERRLAKINESVEKQLKEIRQDNTKQLNEMRETVDEKLQKTLNERLSQSFEVVGRQLQSVQQGLGEMKNLAKDVGGLKRVLSNVKLRGGIGEVQLAMLLEQILAPEQYASNVKTKPTSNAIVEFAIKLPGRSEDQEQVWLPIDAKFPKEVYEQLQAAYDLGEPEQIAAAQKQLDNTIKGMAKDISSKYVAPPFTTEFAILFLPFEGIYAEVVRKASLLESLQRDYKVIVTGPTTLAAILNSLQMGFRTLAIQKRSSEVWQILDTVKTEFDKFGGLMQKAQKNIQTGLNQLDDVIGVRTRAIQRQLKEVTKQEGQLSTSKQTLLDDFNNQNGKQ